jgi:hypothetical protein
MQTKLLLPFYFLTLLFSVSLQAQTVGHLTVFSDEGDKFFLILNGERQNNVAQTNMRVEDLNQAQYSTKVIFEDQTLGEISKNLFLADESGTLMDVTYKIKRDKNGKPKLGALPFSFVPVRQGFVAPANVHVVHYGTPPPPAATTVTKTTTNYHPNHCEHSRNKRQRRWSKHERYHYRPAIRRHANNYHPYHYYHNRL